MSSSTRRFSNEMRPTHFPYEMRPTHLIDEMRTGRFAIEARMARGRDEVRTVRRSIECCPAPTDWFGDVLSGIAALNRPSHDGS